MRKKIALGSLVLPLLTSCATTSYKEIEEKYKTVQASVEFQNEKDVFKKRMNGKTLCSEVGVSDLIAPNGLAPSKDCLYPTSKLKVDAYTGKVDQNLNTLKVVQVLSDGFIINTQYLYSNGYRLSYRTSEQVVFIRKTNEEAIVDGAYLDSQYDWSLYEYLGVYQYPTAIGGSKTVHSFRKISPKQLQDAKKDFKAYDIWKEFLIENRLWNLMEQLEQREQSLKQQ